MEIPLDKFGLIDLYLPEMIFFFPIYHGLWYNLHLIPTSNRNVGRVSGKLRLKGTSAAILIYPPTQSRAGNQVREGGSGLNPGLSQKLPRNKTGQHQQATYVFTRLPQNHYGWKRTLRSASQPCPLREKLYPITSLTLFQFLPIAFHPPTTHCCEEHSSILSGVPEAATKSPGSSHP